MTNKQETYQIFIPRTDGVAAENDHKAFCVNGRMVTVAAGEWVDVPRSVYDLWQMQRTREKLTEIGTAEARSAKGRNLTGMM